MCLRQSRLPPRPRTTVADTAMPAACARSSASTMWRVCRALADAIEHRSGARFDADINERKLFRAQTAELRDRLVHQVDRRGVAGDALERGKRRRQLVEDRCGQSADSTRASPSARNMRGASGQRRVAASMSANTSASGRARNVFDLYIEQKVQRLNEQPSVAWMIRLRPSWAAGRAVYRTAGSDRPT